MTPFKSVGRRIVTAYLLFAVACSLIFAISAAVVVEGIEVRLVDERLMEVAAWASPRHAGNLAVDMPAGLSFHHGSEIPVSLRGLPDGVQEVTVDGVGLHVFSGRDRAGPFVAVDHESDYESVELAVYSMFAVGFLGFIGGSVMLGRFMARRFVSPIVDLSAAVAERRPDLPLQDHADELGILARAFAAHTGALRQVLDRERYFTGDVSHELRTPLTIISGAAEVLMLESADRPAAHAAAERIYRAARDAAESVDVLLMLARAPDLIESRVLALAPLLREEVGRYQGLVADKPVRLSFAGGADFSVQAPARLLACAVGNLIRNACVYTAEGEVTVALEGRSVVVCDTGPGLPAAVLAMLGSDTPGAPARGSDGTGLGLALVRRICQQLGATLAVAPMAGGGTRFSLHFPAP